LDCGHAFGRDQYCFTQNQIDMITKNTYNKTPGELAEKIQQKVSRYGLFNPRLEIFKNPVLSRRMEIIAEINGVKFINDSAASSVNATYYSLNRLNGEVIWIVCNDRPETAFEELATALAFKTRHIIACGKAAERLEKLFGARIPVTPARNAEHAVKWASRIAVEGGYVLFSPASPNDRYATEKLSSRFKNAVKKLKNS